MRNNKQYLFTASCMNDLPTHPTPPSIEPQLNPAAALKLLLTPTASNRTDASTAEQSSPRGATTVDASKSNLRRRQSRAGGGTQRWECVPPRDPVDVVNEPAVACTRHDTQSKRGIAQKRLGLHWMRWRIARSSISTHRISGLQSASGCWF